ncbi:MAG: TadG family pilus assembly protein [Alphaproteobacteria bacterium]
MLNSFLNRFRANQRGTVGIWMSLAATTIVGAGAIAVDMGSLYTTRGQLQHTADSAALAAVSALPDEAAATIAAQTYAEKNMPAAAHGAVVSGADITSGNWDPNTLIFTAGGAPVNAYRVTTRRAQSNNNAAPTFFARALGFNSRDVSAAATAAKLSEPGACVTSLSPDGAAAFDVGGTATVQTYDCSVQVNSCDTSALRAQGNVTVNIVDLPDPDDLSGEINICGGADVRGSATLSPAPNTNTGEQETDPFADTPQPDPTLYDDASDCNFNNFSATGDVTLSPGVYCGGIQLTGSGTATFNGTGGSLNDGLYIIKDGSLSVAGTINVVGNGVTFFTTGADATINFAGTADIGLTAPTTGPLAGFVIFGDADAPATTPHTMRGTSLGGYNGFIYLPEAALSMIGTATGTSGVSDCTVVVADTVDFSGTANFEARSTCDSFGGPPTTRVALVN